MATDRLLTLREAADRLGVHYMTAYSYVRTGRLDARREGVEWRIRARDVESLLEPNGRGARRRPPGFPSRLMARMVAGDERGAWSLVERSLIGGFTPARVHLEGVIPALRSIGRQWERGRLGIGDEHRASSVAQRIIARLGPQFTQPGRTRGTVVLGCVVGERHAMASALLGDLLRGQRFSVVDLGADTPAASFVDATRAANRPLAVVVGAIGAGHVAAVEATLGTLRAATLGVPLLAGGPGIPSASAAHALGAEGWTGHDGAAAVASVTSLLGGPS